MQGQIELAGENGQPVVPQDPVNPQGQILLSRLKVQLVEFPQGHNWVLHGHSMVPHGCSMLPQLDTLNVVVVVETVVVVVVVDGVVVLAVVVVGAAVVVGQFWPPGQLFG